ncbi:MAG: sigma-54-dependent transcriptional regulator [Persicimonas sp.]
METTRDNRSILVVDDHREMAELLAAKLGDEGYDVRVAGGGERALEVARDELPDLVITDLRMEEVDGFDVLEAVHDIDPLVPVLIMTAFGAVESAVEAIKRGAFHYVTKPFQLDEVLVYVERALDDRRVRRENRSLRRIARERSSLDEIIGSSQPMQRLKERIEKVAATDLPVLIRGESGTGKELVARAIHFLGSRSDRAFVPVNCTVLPDSLLESELFGHASGAYTGAQEAREGLFAQADRGTLMLDEIGDMPLELQVKLLRVLEEGRIRAVGSDERRSVDVRIVAATHQDLSERVADGDFREDLLYRLEVLTVDVPPLRERTDDIPLLVRHFIEETRASHPDTVAERFSSAALDALIDYEWPGNVRQLENVVNRLVVLCDEEVVELDQVRLQTDLVGESRRDPRAARDEVRPLREVTDEYIAWALDRFDGNKTRAAEALGIDPSTIYRRDIDEPQG